MLGITLWRYFLQNIETEQCVLYVYLVLLPRAVDSVFACVLLQPCTLGLCSLFCITCASLMQCQCSCTVYSTLQNCCSVQQVIFENAACHDGCTLGTVFRVPLQCLRYSVYPDFLKASFQMVNSMVECSIHLQCGICSLDYICTLQNPWIMSTVFTICTDLCFCSANMLFASEIVQISCSIPMPELFVARMVCICLPSTAGLVQCFQCTSVALCNALGGALSVFLTACCLF